MCSESRYLCLGVIVALVLGVACADSAPPPNQPEPPQDPVEFLQAEIVSQVGRLDEAERQPINELARELATEWLREAGHDEYTAQIMYLLRGEFAATMVKLDASQRRDFLRAEVYDRRARRLGRLSFALGKRVVDQSIAPADAEIAGRAILEELAVLTRLVETLRDRERVRVLRVELQEASLEAVYAVQGGAMSHRLSLYAADKNKTPAPDVETAPPDVEPAPDVQP